jgi:hypothetical protein
MQQLLLESPSRRVLADSPALKEAREIREIRQFLNTQLDRSFRLPKGSFLDFTVTLTPAQCQYIIDNHNNLNRPIRKAKIAGWAKIIREGKFATLSQGISFARDRLLNNGQHRLLGAIQSGKPITVKMTFGDEASAYSLLDSGIPRTAGDTLSAEGRTNPALLAASARVVAVIDKGDVSTSGDITNADVSKIVKEKPELEEATSDGNRIYKKLRCTGAGMVAAVYVILTKSDHTDRLPEFVDRLVDGVGLEAKSPILKLREGLRNKTLRPNTSHSVTRAIYEAAAVIKAWNKHVSGVRGGIRWDVEDGFPDPH